MQVNLVFLCFLLSNTVFGLSAENGKSLLDANVPADANGPTVLLGYSKQNFKQNPIESFMYFVPLVSPTLVDRYTSPDNRQQVGIISYDKKISSHSFHLVCEFEMLGSGFHKNTFEPAGVIAMYIGELEKGETMTNLLEYINFEGQGFGRIEVNGTISNSVLTVTEVEVQFNARNHKSPVTVGLYDVKPRNGEYKYENRSNHVIARVNKLSFKKTGNIPRMGIKVASISKAEKSEGFISRVKGRIANLLLRPPPVTKRGNQAMLDFGHALLEQKPSFTFPLAQNIKEN